MSFIRVSTLTVSVWKLHYVQFRVTRPSNMRMTTLRAPANWYRICILDKLNNSRWNETIHFNWPFLLFAILIIQNKAIYIHEMNLVFLEHLIEISFLSDIFNQALWLNFEDRKTNWLIKYWKVISLWYKFIYSLYLFIVSVKIHL